MRLRQGYATALSCAALACSPCHTRSATEPSYRAMTAIEAATAVGVNKITYDNLLQGAATELLVLDQIAAGTADTLAVKSYQTALEMYNDAKELWDAKLENARYSFLPPGRIYLSDSTIAKRYDLSITAHRWTASAGYYFTVPEESIQIIWARASGATSLGDSIAIASIRELVR